MSKTKTILFCVIFFLNYNSFKGQTTFVKTVSYGMGMYFRDVIVANDGSYMFVGTTMDTKLILLKSDPQGTTQWIKIYPSGVYSSGASFNATSDGGYIITGYISAGYTDMYDVLLLKTDNQGVVQWTKYFGGYSISNEFGNCVIQTSDGGYLVTGSTESFGAGSADIFLIKTNASGSIIWKKTYGQSDYQEANFVQQTADGGYIITGSTDNAAGDVFLLKTDSQGNVVWSKTYGGSSREYGYCVKQTAGGGFIVTGVSLSLANNYKIYLFKTDSIGNVLWSKQFGDAQNEDGGWSVSELADSSIVVSGQTGSFGNPFQDFLLLKTTKNGALIWSRSYKIDDQNYARSHKQTADGGFIMCGLERVYSQDTKACLIKTDALGHSGCNERDSLIAENTFSTTVAPIIFNVSTPNFNNQSANITDYFTFYSDQQYCLTVSVNKTDEPHDGVLVYPNPAPGKFVLKIDRDITNGMLILSNSLGQIILKQTILRGANSIKLEGASRGLYYYSIFDSGKIVSNGKVGLE